MRDAIEFFDSVGATYVELPWTVKEDYSNITKPEEARNFIVKDKVLVASGEQSFLELLIEGKYEFKEDNIYYGITPCFRDDIEDETHRTYFMKLELFSVSSSKLVFNEIIRICNFYMSKYKQNLRVKYINKLNVDIESVDGIEYGSYSMRSFKLNNNKEYSWICGTGIAIPRFYN